MKIALFPKKKLSFPFCLPLCIHAMCQSHNITACILHVYLKFYILIDLPFKMKIFFEFWLNSQSFLITNGNNSISERFQLTAIVRVFRAFNDLNMANFVSDTSLTFVSSWTKEHRILCVFIRSGQKNGIMKVIEQTIVWWNHLNFEIMSFLHTFKQWILKYFFSFFSNFSVARSLSLSLSVFWIRSTNLFAFSLLSQYSVPRLSFLVQLFIMLLINFSFENFFIRSNSRSL